MAHTPGKRKAANRCMYSNRELISCISKPVQDGLETDWEYHIREDG